MLTQRQNSPSWILLALLLGLILLASACGVIMAASGPASSEPPPSWTEPPMTTTTPPPTISPPTITSGAPLSPWDQNLDGYNFKLAADYGLPPYAFSASGLPPGLSINSGTGAISGTPSTSGIFSGTFTVTDSDGRDDTQSFSITINAKPAVTPGTPPVWDQNLGGYSLTVKANSGTPPYSFSASGLPPGLSIVAATGAISGMPTSAGNFSVTLTVTDSIGGSGSLALSIPINASPSFASGAPASPWTRDLSGYSFSVTAKAGVPPYTFSASGLPPGLSISAATGFVSGTPITAGTFAGTFNLTDSIGGTGAQPFSIVIVLPETTPSPTPSPTPVTSATPSPAPTPTPIPSTTPSPAPALSSSTTPAFSHVTTAVIPPVTTTTASTLPPSHPSPVLPVVLGTIGAAGIAAAGLMLVKKARLRSSYSNNDTSNNLQPLTPRGKMSVLPRSDPGIQHLELATPAVIEAGVHFIPVPDPGKQAIAGEEPDPKKP